MRGDFSTGAATGILVGVLASIASIGIGWPDVSTLTAYSTLALAFLAAVTIISTWVAASRREAFEAKQEENRRLSRAYNAYIAMTNEMNTIAYRASRFVQQFEGQYLGMGVAGAALSQALHRSCPQRESLVPLFGDAIGDIGPEAATVIHLAYRAGVEELENRAREMAAAYVEIGPNDVRELLEKSHMAVILATRAQITMCIELKFDGGLAASTRDCLVRVAPHIAEQNNNDPAAILDQLLAEDQKDQAWYQAVQRGDVYFS
ncbi:hypothetical protein [Pyruvatibacter mobilis]|uniref:hypothetical protein n=1 Tax=Pyruvatibacter mobilis TaxID=1712261 RepID=UPI003C7DAF81